MKRAEYLAGRLIAGTYSKPEQEEIAGILRSHLEHNDIVEKCALMAIRYGDLLEIHSPRIAEAIRTLRLPQSPQEGAAPHD